MVRGIFLTVVFVYFFLSTYHITVCTYITAGNDVAWVLTHIYIYRCMQQFEVTFAMTLIGPDCDLFNWFARISRPC